MYSVTRCHGGHWGSDDGLVTYMYHQFSALGVNVEVSIHSDVTVSFSQFPYRIIFHKLLSEVIVSLRELQIVVRIVHSLCEYQLKE